MSTAPNTIAALFETLGATASDATTARTPAQEKLVRAALAVFAEQGFEGASTRAIAARAGVAEKTLFQHFGSKAGLFNEAVFPLLLELIGPRLFKNLRAVIETAGDDFRARLHAIGDNRLAATAHDPAALKFLAQELLLRPEFRASFVAYWSTYLLPPLRTAVETAMTRGEIRTMPAGRFVRIFVSIIVGYALTRHVLLPDLDWNDDEELDAMIDVFFRGVGNGKRRASSPR